VKVGVTFRGRELTHTKLGHELYAKLSEDLAEVAAMEGKPKVSERSER